MRVSLLLRSTINLNMSMRLPVKGVRGRRWMKLLGLRCRELSRNSPGTLGGEKIRLSWYLESGRSTGPWLQVKLSAASFPLGLRIVKNT